MDSDTMFFHDPEQACNRLLLQKYEHSVDSRLDDSVRLTTQAQDDDTGELGGRVSVDVGEVEIERDKDSTLTGANVDDPLIRLAT